MPFNLSTTNPVCSPGSPNDPVSNGSVVFTLSAPATVTATGSAAPATVTFNLDSYGNVPAQSTIYGNAELTPLGTVYSYTIYTAANGGGSILYGPTTAIVGSSAPYAGQLYPNLTVLPPYLLTAYQTLNVVIGTGSAVPGTGSWGQINVPYSFTVTGWTITANASGSAVVDILAWTHANFPGSLSSICGSIKPTLSSAQKNQNLTLTGWGSFNIPANSEIQFNLDPVTTCERINVTLNITVPAF